MIDLIVIGLSHQPHSLVVDDVRPIDVASIPLAQPRAGRQCRGEWQKAGAWAATAAYSPLFNAP